MKSAGEHPKSERRRNRSNVRDAASRSCPRAPWKIGAAALCALLMLAGASGIDAQAGTTTRVSVGIGGAQANGNSARPALSADGRYVAFESEASNLVPGDTNGTSDIFVHDRQTGQTARVSLATGGGQANGASTTPALSADGRYVAFVSFAPNFVPGDAFDTGDIFVHDRQTGQTSRVSVVTGGGQANGDSATPALSADGRYVAFASLATNLVLGDSNLKRDIFVHDRQTGQTSRVSVVTGGGQANGDSATPALSADGRYVAFASLATNLWPNDTSNGSDVFVHDRQTGQTTRVSVATGGMVANSGSFTPAFSADGRYVAFASPATNLVPGDTNLKRDIFVKDRQTSQTSRVSVATGGGQGNGESVTPALSADGRYVAFSSFAQNLVPGDRLRWDIFVHDRQTGETTWVSVAPDGTGGLESSFNPSLSADGRYVAFESHAYNLVPGDTNARQDIFVHDRDATPVDLDLVPVNPQPQFPYCPAFGSDKVTLIVTVRNNSTTHAAPPTITRLQFTSQGLVFYNKTSPTPGIAPGGSVNVSFPMPINPAPPGDWIVGVKADSGNQVSETNESNNSMTGRCIR